MISRLLLVFSLLALSVQASAAEPTTGPIVDGYGAAFVVENSDVPLLENHVYKVVFEITEYDSDLSSLNRNLERVARFLNLHAKNGVSPENIQAAVVMHGAALVNALSNEAYQARFEQDNPNLDLVQKLAAAGVRLYVCGQSMAGRGFEKSELSEPFKLATSALTMMHQLQYEGYTIQP
jgi:intracellular sulfur oxidation DsrE/DsrF family protein